ncbi:hypothetical protein D3C78_1933850 [compost metagenome]
MMNMDEATPPGAKLGFEVKPAGEARIAIVRKTSLTRQRITLIGIYCDGANGTLNMGFFCLCFFCQ